MTDRLDYVAIKNGNAYALMSAEHATFDDIRQFCRENAGADIRLLPVAEAVALHLQYLARVSDEHAKREDPKGLSGEAMPARSCEAGDAHE